MSRLPALDMHAHVNPEISEDALLALNAVVFAVTRSLDEAELCLQRNDTTTVWGVGCHPSLAKAHAKFSQDRFSGLIARAAYAGEFGLDGKARVPLETQRATLRSAFEAIASEPRIISLHSYAATAEIIHELERVELTGVVLHWWLGDPALTARAVELGCYFSLPPASARRRELLRALPLERCLTETDHPFGDRRGKTPRPGNVDEIERALGALHDLAPDDVRSTVWSNLSRLVKNAGCGSLLPGRIRTLLASLPPV
jgi:TatD DNase family protein